MSSGIDIPAFYQSENEYIKSSSSPILTGISVKWQNFKKSTAAGKIWTLIILLVVVFISIVCWMNMVAYIRIAYHEDDNQGISITWAIFGAIMNGLFAFIALLLAIGLLIKIFKGEQQVEKQSRKFVGSVIDGARLYANKAVKEAVSKVIIDPDDIDSAKAFIVTSTNAVIDNTLDRYKSSILEGISD
jgi:hypothetical protein